MGLGGPDSKLEDIKMGNSIQRAAKNWFKTLKFCVLLETIQSQNTYSKIQVLVSKVLMNSAEDIFFIG